MVGSPAIHRLRTARSRPGRPAPLDMVEAAGKGKVFPARHACEVLSALPTGIAGGALPRMHQVDPGKAVSPRAPGDAVTAMFRSLPDSARKEHPGSGAPSKTVFRGFRPSQGCEGFVAASRDPGVITAARTDRSRTAAVEGARSVPEDGNPGNLASVRAAPSVSLGEQSAPVRSGSSWKRDPSRPGRKRAAEGFGGRARGGGLRSRRTRIAAPLRRAGREHRHAAEGGILEQIVGRLARVTERDFRSS